MHVGPTRAYVKEGQPKRQVTDGLAATATPASRLPDGIVFFPSPPGYTNPPREGVGAAGRGPSSTDVSMAADASAAQAEDVAGSARGKGRGCEGRPAVGVFSGCFADARHPPPPEKEPGKASRLLPGKQALRRVVIARLGPSWKRVADPAGRRIPKGPPLGAGPGRRELRVPGRVGSGQRV